MRKWTKGFLIFGVVTSIIGFTMMIIGIQTDGVRSLLAMSQNPVFESRMEELTFDQDIENLNISLTDIRSSLRSQTMIRSTSSIIQPYLKKKIFNTLSKRKVLRFPTPSQLHVLLLVLVSRVSSLSQAEFPAAMMRSFYRYQKEEN